MWTIKSFKWEKSCNWKFKGASDCSFLLLSKADHLEHSITHTSKCSRLFKEKDVSTNSLKKILYTFFFKLLYFMVNHFVFTI